MQIRCRHCHRPYGMKRDEVHAALDLIHKKKLKHYNSPCPHCGKNNRVSQNQLRRAAPGWTRPSPADVVAAEGAESE